jgi:FtsP/CotA-like multicopper oxidase with cupredoxin domain/peroxiredoxin
MANRRKIWLSAMLAAFVCVAAGIIAWQFQGRENTTVPPAPPVSAKPPPEQERLAKETVEPFATTDAIRSVDGVLAATLTVEYGDNKIQGERVHLRSYNGQLVGPTLRAKPGDVFKIRVDNRLPEIPEASAHAINVPHALNSTNIHTHGLHVSPEGNSDNPYRDIKPGQAQDYEIKIPKNHVAGTFWYHPHRHGSVALQVSSGMSGALIIEGGLDDVTEIKAAHDRIFVFQQIPFDDKGQVENLPILYDGKPVKHWHETGRFTTINGAALPVITLRPGEVERWRFIHAGVHELITVRLDGHKLHEIATDGIPLGRMAARNGVELQPGNRSDVLIKAGAPGIYLLRDADLPADGALQASEKPERFLAKVVVAGPAKEMDLPESAALAGFAPFKEITDEEIQGRKTTLVFRADEEHKPPRYFIDDRQFDPVSVPRRVLLGTAEEWTLSSTEGNHPFHLHVNPFEVIKRDPETGKIVERVWRDTVLVAAKKPVTIRVRYLDFTGKTVLHCHNLAHEDLGMMQNIEMVRTPAELKKTTGLLLPWRPPAWKLSDGAGQRHGSNDLKGQTTLLVFYQGGSCPHCLQQLKMLQDFASTPQAKGLRFVAVSPEPAEVLARTQKWLGGDSILLLADETTEVFGLFHCLAEEEPQHGIFLLNAQGQVVWYRVSAQPLTDVTPLRRALDAL